MLNLALIRSGMNQPPLIGHASEADPCGHYSLRPPHLPLYSIQTRTNFIKSNLNFSFSHQLLPLIMVDRSPSIAAIGVIGRHVSSYSISNTLELPADLGKRTILSTSTSSRLHTPMRHSNLGTSWNILCCSIQVWTYSKRGCHLKPLDMTSDSFTRWTNE